MVRVGEPAAAAVTGRDRTWSMSEADLQESVRKMCDHLGLAVRHVRDERGNWLPGWPDLDIVGKRLIHRELKSQRGQLTPDQRRVGYLLANAGQDWAVWRPSDLLGGTVAKELVAISPLEIAVFSADSIERFTI